jgi:hypothetical protein
MFSSAKNPKISSNSTIRVLLLYVDLVFPSLILTSVSKSKVVCSVSRLLTVRVLVLLSNLTSTLDT